MFNKTEKQAELIKLLSSGARNILAYGGSRSGKSAILVYAIIVRAIKIKSRHLIVRLHFNHVKQSIWLDTLPKILKLINEDYYQLCKFNNSDFYITLPNKSEIWIGGIDDKDRMEKILGNEFSTVFMNECSQMTYAAYNILRTRLAEKNALRKKLLLDQNPPKKSHWTYKLFHQYIDPDSKLQIKKHNFVSMLMNPYDNTENIDPDYIEELKSLPKRDRDRFLEGKYGEASEGKVFREEWIQRFDQVSNFDRIVVALDPAVSNKETSDEFGIIVCAKKGDFGYILEDASGKYSPDQWSKVAVDLYHKWSADRIIGESNNGGDMIESVLRSVDRTISYSQVRATRGKVKRAEPVAALYEKKMIYHYGYFDKLESEMVEFDYEEEKNTVSPNRVDAMCWGITELFCLNKGSIRFRSL